MNADQTKLTCKHFWHFLVCRHPMWCISKGKTKTSSKAQFQRSALIKRMRKHLTFLPILLHIYPKQPQSFGILGRHSWFTFYWNFMPISTCPGSGGPHCNFYLFRVNILEMSWNVSQMVYFSLKRNSANHKQRSHITKNPKQKMSTFFKNSFLIL